MGQAPNHRNHGGHVKEVIRTVKNRGKIYQAHNLFSEARRLFSWAIDQGDYGLDRSPFEKLKPNAIVGEKKKLRTRILNDSEWRALWRATESMGYPYGPLLRMLALTGQRKSEVAEARWPEFDLAAKSWVIPAERMKMDAPHVVPLIDDVLEILKSLPRSRGDYLFSTEFGAKPVNGFGQAKMKLDKAMAAELGGTLDPFVIHDIRRTMRTGLSALPVPALVRELVIAHTKPGLHKVYDQFEYLDEKRRALDLWAARLRSIITGDRPGNVVALHGAAS
jgi:integrase